MREIRYSLGFADDDRKRAAWLYNAAFGEKIKIAIPDEARRLAVLAEGFEESRAIIAEYRDRIVGLAGFHHREKSLTSGITVSILRRRTGMLGMLRAVAAFAFFEREPKPGELLMDGIAVDPAMRGQGIGTGLLRELSVYAGEQGYRSIRLDVVDTNERAYKLYRREGFVATERVESAWLGRILGFSAATTMHKEIHIDPKEPPSP